jgi:hypothetical protein
VFSTIYRNGLKSQSLPTPITNCWLQNVPLLLLLLLLQTYPSSDPPYLSGLKSKRSTPNYVTGQHPTTVPSTSEPHHLYT